MGKKKSFELNEVIFLFEEKKSGHKGMSREHALAEALYISSKGTIHFYESLELLSKALPEVYGEDFRKLQGDK